MTVGQLRTALADVSDDLPIEVEYPGEYRPEYGRLVEVGPVAVVSSGGDQALWLTVGE
jgi:hypothetical protein